VHWVLQQRGWRQTVTVPIEVSVRGGWVQSKLVWPWPNRHAQQL
jgi:hypothetical protein